MIIRQYTQQIVTTKTNEQIINNVADSYNVKMMSLEENMKKKKVETEYKVIREYKKLFSCYELITCIIKNHNNKDIEALNYK